ncbi:hypothetical protein GDO86_000788 [Hymenochirus boettgeri]|uniref:Starch-binding domain-containing protein 1 n=1 Tax=Hymenochirus boettgeri TaxID=247094 RepID=A0A8T2KEH0_9PIPI|nr:hypothetical protein GDO86_000788 [Hymenochirus boettgeri]
MVHAGKPHSPVGGKQGAVTGEATGNMWVVLVLGVLTAIFAWIWFGGSKKKSPESPKEQVEIEEPCTASKQDREDSNSPAKEPSQAEGKRNPPGHVTETVVLDGQVDIEEPADLKNESNEMFNTNQELSPEKKPLLVLTEQVAALPDVLCEDQVVECKHIELENEYLEKPADLQQCSPMPEPVILAAIPLSQNHQDADDLDSLSSELNGENIELMDPPEKAEQVGAPVDVKLPDADHMKMKRVAAVQPMTQNIKVDFKVHYITHSDSQLLAVVGDHEKLGGWEIFVPLAPTKDGFWSHSVFLPADTNVEWKFVMVENGKIKRWEECENRSLATGHDDVEANEWWGYH